MITVLRLSLFGQPGTSLSYLLPLIVKPFFSCHEMPEAAAAAAAASLSSLACWHIAHSVWFILDMLSEVIISKFWAIRVGL